MIHVQMEMQCSLNCCTCEIRNYQEIHIRAQWDFKLDRKRELSNFSDIFYLQSTRVFQKLKKVM